MYRQGDVLLIPTRTQRSAEATSVARQAGRLILAEGEATGHVHAIDEALAELFTELDGQLYLRVAAAGGAALRHEEHATLTVRPGTYRVVRQREYSPEAIRSVAD